MLKWFVAFLVLVAAGAWVLVPFATASGSSWCGRVESYEQDQRLLHQGALPWSADMRIGLSGCRRSNGSHPAFRP